MLSAGPALKFHEVAQGLVQAFLSISKDEDSTASLHSLSYEEILTTNPMEDFDHYHCEEFFTWMQ